MIQSRSNLLLILALMGVGCTSLPTDKRAEPEVIVIRNSSNVDLKVVSFREAGNPGLNPVRFGSISPVLRGLAQVIDRPSSSPPLIDTVEVAWMNYQGREHVKKVSLKQARNSQTGEGEEALVFDIRSSGIVNVFREEYRQLY
jgi:hypothetical protein